MTYTAQDKLCEARKIQPLSIVEAFLIVESGIKKYLMRFLMSTDEIEDIVQEAFLRAWNFEKTQQIQSPKSFLFKVAKNIALTELLRKRNQIVQYVGDLHENDDFESGLSVETNYDINHKLGKLADIINTLPPQCRKVLVMRKVLGFSHKEIAARMNISTRTVEVHLTRGLRRCQEVMQQAILEDDENLVRRSVIDE